MIKLSGRTREPPEPPIARDKDGVEMYAEDIVGMVDAEVERRKTERLQLELQWTLNANFLAGHQYCDINPVTNSVEDYDPVHEYEQRETYNRIAPLMETRFANLKSVDFAMRVLPRTNEPDDYSKAKVSTSLLRYTQQTGKFDALKDNSIQWAELCGTAFVMSWWDANKGDEVARIDSVDEKGITQSRVLRDGGLAFGLLSPYEVYPESIFKQEISDQRSVIVEQVVGVEDVYDLYGMELEGEEIDAFSLTPVQVVGGHGYPATAMSLSTRKVKDAVRLRYYFERSSRRYPDGRLIITAQNTLLYYGALPCDEIPIVAIRSKPVAGRFFGKSVIEDLIPYQRAYNGVKNKIHDYIKTLAENGFLIDEGSIDVEKYEQIGVAPGALIQYRHGFNKPEPITVSNLPDTVFAECRQIAQDMEYTAGVSQLMVTGAAPAGVTSGTAIDNLRQIDSTRMSLTADSIRSGVRDTAVIWLKLYKKYASGYRALKISGGNDSGAVLMWCASDITSYDVEYTTENELMFSRDEQRNALLQMLQLGLLTDDNGAVSADTKRRLMEAMRLGDYTDVLGEVELQKQNARRENAYFEAGVIPEIYILDDHAVHVSEHRSYALQNDFRLLSGKMPELADGFIAHINGHQRKIQEMVMQAQAQALLQIQQTQGGMKENGKEPARGA